MKEKNTMSFKLAMLAVALTVFSGCEVIDSIKKRFSKKKEVTVIDSTKATSDNPFVVYINGDPVLRKDEVNQQIQMLVQNQFQGAIAVESLPASLKKALINNIVDREIIVSWGKKNGIDTNVEFNKLLDEYVKAAKSHLYIEFFNRQIFDSIEVTDAEVRSDYTTNKSKYIKAPGGTLAVGLKFEKADDAKSFMSNIKGKEADFESIAKNQKDAAFKSFGRVDAEAVNRDIPKNVKEAIVHYNGDYPSVLSVKDDNAQWVVCLTDHKDAEIYPFDDIKGHLEMMIRHKKANDAMMKKLQEIKGTMSVEVKEDLIIPAQSAPAVNPLEALNEAGEQLVEEPQGPTVA